MTIDDAARALVQAIRRGEPAATGHWRFSNFMQHSGPWGVPTRQVPISQEWAEALRELLRSVDGPDLQPRQRHHVVEGGQFGAQLALQLGDERAGVQRLAQGLVMLGPPLLEVGWQVLLVGVAELVRPDHPRPLAFDVSGRLVVILGDWR
jgi:hypothetical protein